MLEQVCDLSNYNFSLYSIPTAVATVGILLLGLLVLIRERLSFVSVSFHLITITVSVWLLTFSFTYSATDPAVALWWIKAGYFGIPFIAPATYQFTVSVLRVYDRYKPIVWVSWLLSSLFAALALQTDQLVSGHYLYWWGYYTRYNWLGLVFNGYFICMLVASMVHYWIEYKMAPPGTHKRRIKSFMIAFAIGYIAAADYVAGYGIPIYPFGYVAIFGFILLAARAIWIYRLVDITPAFAAKQIIDTMTDALLVLDREGVVRLVNRAASDLFGYRKEELAGRPVGRTINSPLFSDQLESLVAAGTIRNYEMPYKPKGAEARTLSLSASVMRDQSDQPVAIVCIARDITERKKAEEAVRESEERYRAVVEQASEGIFMFDIDTRQIVEANAAFQHMVGYNLDELLERTVYDIVGQDRETVDRSFSRILREGRYFVGERRYRRKDGTLVDVEDSSNVIFHRGRAVSCVVVHDITERKRAQERIRRQLDRLAALRSIDMAITASLDLRVTLNVILEQVTEQLRVDSADVLLLKPHTQALEYAAGRGFRFDTISRSRLRLGEGYAGRAALERRTLGIPDLNDTQFDGAEFQRNYLLMEEGFVCYYAVPLQAKGQVKGVLEIFSRSSFEPDREWLSFLEALAGQAAIAIDNATLFDDLQRSNFELARAYDTTLEGWSRALDLRDRETEGHTRRVTDLTVRLAEAMGIGGQDLHHVRRGALLHDIGKMGIPDSVLLKPGPLTEEEREVMECHPVYAYELLSPIPFLHPALDIPYCHHERWDGNGYPRGLKGEQIPLAARVFAVVDVWDALRSNRPYRPGWSEEKVREHIRSLAGSHFDPKVVEAFLAMDLSDFAIEPDGVEPIAAAAAGDILFGNSEAEEETRILR